MKNKELGEEYDKVAGYWHNLRMKGKEFYNTYLDMPNNLKVIGNVKGKKVLDLGCGTGVYAKWLVKKGANVKGIDISASEIKIAEKYCPKGKFEVGNAEKLPYKNKEFDVVLAALVLEHLKKWDIILKEIRRVLKKGGFFVFSTGNPVMNCIRRGDKGFFMKRNYFKEHECITNWWDKATTVWYHKPIGIIIKLLVKNDFELVDFEDARPLKKSKKLFPKEYSFTSALPYFCTWKFRKK